MGKHKSLIINIPEPCMEAWNEMLPENNGRFCLSCRKKVVDFSVMSDNEILQTLSATGKDCCGRFETTQLERLITPPVQSSAPFFPTALLVTLLTALTPETGNARQLINTTASVTKALDMDVPTCIEGRIIDASTGNGVPGVTIVLKGSSTDCTADQTGDFKLNIPNACYNGLPVLKISCIGYETKEFALDSSYTLPYSISLNKVTNDLNEVVVVSFNSYKADKYTTGAVIVISAESYYRPGWWQRLTHIFRKKQQHNQ